MQYVYKIELLNNCIYIGTTNNLRRRRDQHNENARKKKSYFGKFLNKNNIVLKEEDLKVLESFDNRKEAFRKEEELIKYYDKQKDVILLNYEKTQKGSRKNMNIGHTALKWVVVNIDKHTIEEVFDIRQYEIKNNITRGCLHRTAYRNSVCNNNLKCFLEEDWQKLTEKEKQYYISGKFLTERENNIRNNKSKRYSKQYKLLEKSTNKILVVKNLDEFAREHNMSSGTLHSTFRTGHFCKGYKVIERL